MFRRSMLCRFFLWGLVIAGIAMAVPVQAHPPGRHHGDGNGSTQTATGRVFLDTNKNGTFDADDQPLADVGVSNGREIVETDAEGRYRLPVTDDTILFVIKPRGFRPPFSKDMLPQFYYIHKPEGSPDLRYPGVEPTGPLPDSVDFPLYKQREPEEFSTIFFGDPQPRDQKEIDYIAHNVVEDLIRLVRATPPSQGGETARVAFGVTLGDIMNNDISLFESLNRTIARIGIPWYYVIGNHDLNFDTTEDRYSDETFERVYGPPYYSFDYGPVHFLALDDVVWLGRDRDRHYISGLGEQQLEFIGNDLARVPRDRLVVLMMHIPLVDSTPWKEEERQALFRLIEDRPHCISIAAHEHHHEHKFLGKEHGWRGAKKHHHVVNVTVSGAWWRGAPNEYGIPHAMMADGAPNGYSVMTFNGTEYRLRFQAAGRPADFQMHIDAPDAVAASETAETEVYANVFNALPDARVEMRIGRHGTGPSLRRGALSRAPAKGRPLNGKPSPSQGETGRNAGWTKMTRVQKPDPIFLRMKQREEKIPDRPWRDPPGPKPSPHLWQAQLPSELPTGTHLITVRAETQDGQTVTGHRILRVTSQ